MKRKALSIAVATSIATLSLAGCSSQTSTSSADATSSTDPVQISYTTWADTSSDNVEQEITNEFNASQSDIVLTYIPTPSDDYGTKLNTNLAAGTAPDIFQVGEGDMYMYYGEGVTENLSPYAENDTNFDLAGIDKALVDQCTFNNELHYVTNGFTSIALYYNKDLFDKYGVSYPTDDWTWDDLEATAKQLTHPEDNVYGYYADNWTYDVLIYLHEFGADIGNEDATEADGYINSPEAVDAITKYTNYSLKDGISPSTSSAKDYGGAEAMFENDAVAMMMTGGWDISTFNDAGTNYGTALVPAGPDGKANIVCSSNFAMYNKTKNPDQAWQVLSYLTSRDSNTKRAQEEDGVPIYDDMMQDSLSDPNLQTFNDMLQYSFKPVGLRGENGHYFNAGLDQAMEEILVNQTDVQTALDDAATSIDQTISQNS